MRRLVRFVGLLVVLAVLLLGVVAVRIVVEARSDDRRASDVIVVLGAAQYDGEPQAYLTARLEHALELYQDGVAPDVVTVGGARPGDRFSEAEAGERWLVERGVPADDVVAVSRGGNTLASMSAVSVVMGENSWDSAVVVTDPWHSLRATEMLRQQGRTAFGSPTRTGPANGGLAAAVPYTARETLAYTYWLWQRAST
ncbi:MAG: YdcF family protein [Actinomycetes bacterium]